MLQHRKSQLLTGAVSLCVVGAPLAIAPERKEDDVATLTREVKTAVEGLDKTVADFRTKNDERLKQIEKKQEDVITKEEVEKINKAIDDAIAGVKKELEAVEAKHNRLLLAGGGEGAQAEVKAAADFAQMLGAKDFSVESYREYKAALDGYLRQNKAATTMAVGTDPSGGYLITPDTSGRIIKKVYESSPMRQLASVVTIGTDELEGPIDNGEMDAQWIGEKGARAQTDTPQFGKWKIAANELYAYPWVTQKLLEDAQIDVEAWLAMKAADKFARKETTGFYIGDGQLKPQGVLTYAMAATSDKAGRPWGTFEQVLTGTAGAYPNANPADKLLAVIFALKAAYRQNAKFQMSRATMGETRKLKDGQGNYLVDLRLRNNALVESIFGFENVDAEDMPELADNSLSVGFGDWRETYTIVDRLGISVVRDNITQPGFVKFHFRKRVGGGAINFESAKFLKFH